MKKWIAVVLSLPVLFLAAVYLFIPNNINVSGSIIANANQNGVYRFLTDTSNWSLWWPGSYSGNKNGDHVFESGGYQFKKTTEGYNSVGVVIEKDNSADSSLLHIFSTGDDTLTIDWGVTVHTGSNPLNRIRQHFKAKEIKKQIDTVMAAMQRYISTVKNLYGIDIKREKIKIQFMVSIRKPFPHYPTTEDIYTEMTQIRKYIAQVKAVEIDYPILNISRLDSSRFDLVVAVPVDRQVLDSGVFTDRRLLKNGNVLVAEITGGIHTVDLGLKQIDRFAQDHKFLNVAIPFQQFLTDRTKEADTTKWRTRISYPIL